MDRDESGCQHHFFTLLPGLLLSFSKSLADWTLDASSEGIVFPRMVRSPFPAKSKCMMFCGFVGKINAGCLQ